MNHIHWRILGCLLSLLAGYATATWLRQHPQPLPKQNPPLTTLPAPVHSKVAPNNASPILVVVIDDMGFNLSVAQHFLALAPNITVAIIPHSPHATAVAQMAHNKGHEILVHLPMQPINQQQAEPDALRTDMDPTTMQHLFVAAVQQVPHAIGFNNHTGSRFTSDRAAVQRFLSIVPKSWLILDSRTSGTSQLASVAKDSGFKTLQRNIFLDNNKELTAILRQLEQCWLLARKQGYCLAIGHPYPETASAIQHFFQRHPLAKKQLQPISALIKPNG